MIQQSPLWWDKSWNPTTGCSPIAKGCQNCWARDMARRFWKQWNREPPPDHFKVKLHPDRLDQPLRWKKPRRVFVCSMSDLFHEDVPFEFIDKVVYMMNLTKRHTYLVLTKRPGRMREFFHRRYPWHLSPNIQLGVSVSTQEDADRMIPDLLRMPAAVQWVSFEPLLEKIDTWQYLGGNRDPIGPFYDYEGIAWTVIGAESGHRRRPMKLEWAVDLVRQCKAAKVPCFVKQIQIDGKVSHNPREWPEELQVREYPE